MRVGKQHAAFRQTINVRGVDCAFVSTQTIHPILHVVHDEEQHVGLIIGFRFRRGGRGRKEVVGICQLQTRLACLSVNDAFVMKAWGEDRGAGDKVRLVADGNAALSKALGLDFDGSGIGFGVRAQRFAAIVDDGVVTKLAVEKPMSFEVSSAEAILDAL